MLIFSRIKNVKAKNCLNNVRHVIESYNITEILISIQT